MTRVWRENVFQTYQICTFQVKINLSSYGYIYQILVDGLDFFKLLCKIRCLKIENEVEFIERSL